MLSIEQMEAAIINRSHELLAKWGITGVMIECKTMTGKFKTAGGLASWSTAMGTKHYSIMYSREFIQHNFQEYMEVIVPHEVAHIIQYQKFPFAKQAHGPEWKSICRSLGGTAELTHGMDCQQAGIKKQKRVMTKINYGCACEGKVFPISPQRHRKIEAGSTYRCKRCATRLFLI